jgi:hypothetical protein
MFLITAVCMGFVVVSMAEMASMSVAIIVLGLFEHMSNAEQGTYRWRTVPLGLRVCA